MTIRSALVRSFTLFGLSLVSACDESGPRVYTAQAYDAEADCLEAYAPLGLVEADELPATCEPVCLEGEALYVSTVCAPYPVTASQVTPEESTDCAKALDALATERECEP